MKDWLLTHIDAVIPMVLGIILAISGFSKRAKPTMGEAKRRQLLPMLAMGLVGLGIFRIVMGSIPTTPVTATTDDGIASAVFPKEPVRTEAFDEVEGVKVHRITRSYYLRGVDLRLNQSEYGPGMADLPQEVMLANIKEYLIQRGLTFVGSSELPGSLHEIVMEKPDVGVRQVIRLWFGPKGIYQAVATAEKGYHDDPRVTAFIPSFKITAPVAGK